VEAIDAPPPFIIQAHIYTLRDHRRTLMPAMHFNVRWPDNSTSKCYSPSSTITEFFEAGKSYPLAEFIDISRTALTKASDRVRMKYGYMCSAAMDQLEQIETIAARFRDTADAHVTVEAFIP
jgi:uncharacterized repeat protein (TIGR04042 family)